MTYLFTLLTTNWLILVIPFCFIVATNELRNYLPVRLYNSIIQNLKSKMHFLTVGLEGKQQLWLV